MKKLLSFVIVALMMVSLVVPAFAIPSAPGAPEAENSLNLWIEDSTIDVSETTSAKMIVKVKDNVGFTEMKFIAVYPPCLTLTSLTRGAKATAGISSAIEGKDFTTGGEKTAIDQVLHDFFIEIGLDAETELGPEGTWKAAGPVLDCQRTEEDDETGEDITVDFYGEGMVALYQFEYDASKNTEGLTEIPIKLYGEALHQRKNQDLPYCGEFVNVITHDGKITLLNVPVATCEHNGETEQVNVVPATCTEPGSYDVKCSLCEEIIQTGVVIPALGHDCGEWFEKTPATPEADGVRRRECQREGCDYYEEEPIPYVVPHTHEYTAQVVSLPTADVAGKITYSCECGDSYDVDLPAYGEFAVIANNANAIGGEGFTIPVLLDNTPYGVDSLRFLVSWDEALTVSGIELVNDVYLTDVDELIYTVVDDAYVAALADQAGITIDTAGKDFAVVVIDSEDLAVRSGDGALLNIVGTAPATAGEYAVEIINIEDASVTYYDIDDNFIGFIDYTFANSSAALTVHVHNYTTVLTTAPTADAPGLVTTSCTGCGDVITTELDPYGAFGISPASVSVLGGDAVVLPIELKNTIYGIDTLRFLVYWDETLTGAQLVASDAVYTEAGDEVVITEITAEKAAEFADQAGISLETAGRKFALVQTDVEGFTTRTADGAIANLVFTAPAADMVAKVGVVNIDEPNVSYYDEEENFLGFIDYEVADVVSADVNIHVHNYAITAFVAPKAAEDGKLTYTCACGDTYDVTLDAYGTFGYEVVGAPIHAEASDLYTVNLINTAYGVDAVRFLVYWDEALTVGVAPQPQIFTDSDELTAEEISSERAAALLDKAGVDFDVAGKKFAYVFGLADGLYTLAGEGELVLLTVTAPETAGEYEIGTIAIEDTSVNYYVGDEFIGFIDYDAQYGKATVIVEGHNYEEVIDPEPTCTEPGLKTFTCSICGDQYTEEVPALGHDLVHHDAQPATCTEIGWDAYDTCSRCDYTTYEEIAALGHDLVHHDAQPATCTEIGWDAYDTCSRCDYTTYEEIAALGHDLVHHDAQDPTCTEIGWNAYDTCTRCDYTTYEELPMTPHTPAEEWEVETEPTTTEDGLEVLRCTVCEQIIDQRPIAAKTIDLILVPSTSRLKDWEIDNNAKVINVTAKNGQPIAVFQLKLDGAPQNAFTMSEAAFEAGNKLQIKGTMYSDSQLERPGIRYFVSFATNGYNQSYVAEITDNNGDVYYYTVNVTFEHDPAVGGVVPGYTANKELTGISAEDDHLIQVVSKPGVEDVTFRLSLAKGAKVRVISDAKPHIVQTIDKGTTYVENEQINDNALVYFKTVKADDVREFDLRVTYANGEYEDFHVVVEFID